MKVVLALVGMPGSGKGVFSDAAAGEGIPVYVCGDVVRGEAERRGLPVNREVLGRIMFELRDLEGPSVMVRRLMPKLMAEESNVVVVEGVRSLAEVDELKKSFHVVVCAIHARPQLRFKRLTSRKRSDDPKKIEEFNSRDMKELKIGIGNVIALADKIMVNEDSIKGFKVEARKVLGELGQVGVED